MMADLQRQEDWQPRLIAYLATIARRDFDPEQHHCALFAADAIHAMTGQDLAAEWRGLSIAAGLIALRKTGHVDHIALTASLLTEVPVSFGQPGDVAAVPTPEGLALGIVQGAAIYVLRPTGLGLVSLLSASRMFRIP